MCHTVTHLTTSLLKDIPAFDAWDTTKLEDWLSNIKMAAGILKESWICLVEAKSHGLTCTLICEALQAEKYSDDFEDILHLKLCNANIHTYMSDFMEIQQSETLVTCLHWFKTEAKRCDSKNETATICIFVKGLQDPHNITAKIYKKDPRLYWRSSN